MKIKLWSDLHLEFNAFHYEPTEEDKEMTLVLAGDIGMMRESFYDFLGRCAYDFKNVLYVIGNHEAYGTTEENVLRLVRMYTEEFDNFYVLHNETVILDGVRFIGSPLYANTENSPQYIRDIKFGIADYMRTKVMGEDGLLRIMTPHDTYLRHEEAVSFIESALQIDQGIQLGKEPLNDITTVVITHWPPTHLLTNPNYAGSPLQDYFCNNDEYLMKYYDIDLWLFGHTHQTVDTEDEMFYGTRVVSNARGYGDYEDTGFDENKVIEI